VDITVNNEFDNCSVRLAYVLAIKMNNEKMIQDVNKTNAFTMWNMDSISLVQSLKRSKMKYIKDCGSNKFSFVCEIDERVVELNNQRIQKLESLTGEGVLF